MFLIQVLTQWIAKFYWRRIWMEAKCHQTGRSYPRMWVRVQTDVTSIPKYRKIQWIWKSRINSLRLTRFSSKSVPQKLRWGPILISPGLSLCKAHVPIIQDQELIHTHLTSNLTMILWIQQQSMVIKLPYRGTTTLTKKYGRKQEGKGTLLYASWVEKTNWEKQALPRKILRQMRDILRSFSRSEKDLQLRLPSTSKTKEK